MWKLEAVIAGAFLIIVAFRIVQALMAEWHRNDPPHAKIRAAVLKRLDELAEQDRLSANEYKDG